MKYLGIGGGAEVILKRNFAYNPLVMLGIGALVVEGILALDTSGLVAVVTSDKTVGAVSGKCAVPSGEAVAAVTELFDNPPKPPDFDGKDKFTRGRQYSKWLQQQTEKLGIQEPIFDKEKLLDLEVALSPPNKTRPFSEYIAATRGLLDQSSIPLVIGPPKSMGKDAQIPTAEELETEQAKTHVLRLAKMFTLVPVNFLSDIGVRQIALTAHGKGGTYAGLALTSEGVLIVDLTNTPEEQNGVAEHELYHLLDAYECGWRYMGEDPSYVKINVHTRYNEARPTPTDFLNTMPPVFDEIAEEVGELSMERFKLEDGNADKTAVCTVQKNEEELLKDIEVTSTYSYTTPVEDKAEVGKNMFNMYGYSQMLDKRSPVLRAKFLHLLAQLYERFPNLAKYYALKMAKMRSPRYDCNE